MRKDYDIVGSYDNQRVSTISAERTVNMFEYLDPQGKKPKSLLSTAGLVDTNIDLRTETNGCRAAFVFKNAIYLVYGSSVFRVTGSTGALSCVPIGNLLTVSGYVGIDANTYQVIFVDGQQGFIYDTNPSPFNQFTQITDTGFPAKPIDVCYLDGFFIVANGDTNQFQLSMINQGMVWSGGTAQFPSATFLADASTDILTLSNSNANFATGVPVTLSITQIAKTFTADAGTDILTFPAGVTNANYPTGATIKFSTTVTLPAPLNSTDSFYVIRIGVSTLDPGTIKVATTYANAIALTAIDITTAGAGVHTATIGFLPTPLATSTTYYAIRVGASGLNPGTIKLATSYLNAIANTPIDLTDNGSATIALSVIGQLQQGEITSHPGTIVGCRTLHRRIFFFSQNFTEVWENAGKGTNLPFRRNNSSLMEVGTPAIGSIVVGFDAMFFLAQDKDGLAGVVTVRGTESVLVSNRALDFQLAQYAGDALTGVEDARGILIKENGLIFYRLNFTAANHTFVFNVTMSSQDAMRWHEEEILNGDRHPAQTHAYFDGVNYYGSYNSPKFYIVSDGVSTNDGETIRRMRIGKQMTPEGYNRLRIDRFQLDLLQGTTDIEVNIDIGLDTEDSEALLTESGEIICLEQGINIGGGQPVVFLSVSRDGGQSYGNKLQSTMGKLGQRTYRTVWRKIGTTPRGQGFIPKLEFFNTIPFIILGASWDFEVLPE